VTEVARAGRVASPAMVVETPIEQVPTSPSRGRRWLIEWLVVLAIALVVAIGIRAYVVQTFFIPSGSMEPTLNIGDRIVVDKLSYRFHGVGRGDIVVFKRPPGLHDDPGVTDLVKRVIGLPGERIASGPNGEVLINGKAIAQPWLTASAKADPGINIRPQVIPPDHYFVMGDNRGESEDSRFFGTIDRSLIIGHVVLRIWPLSRIAIMF
jgi:signal peptidase I